MDRLTHGSAPVTEEDLAELRREAIDFFGADRTGIVDWTVAWDVIGLFLGAAADRLGPLPIEAHIENTVKAFKAVRTYALDVRVRHTF